MKKREECLTSACTGSDPDFCDACLYLKSQSSLLAIRTCGPILPFKTPQHSAKCIAVCNLAQHHKTGFFFALQHQQCFIVVKESAPKQLQSLKQVFSQRSRRVRWRLACPFQKSFSSEILAVIDVLVQHSALARGSAPCPDEPHGVNVE